MNRLVIIGAGGHGKVIADIAIKCEYENINFVDDNLVDSCMGFPIIGTTSNLDNYDDGNTDFIIAIGNNETRKKIAEEYDINWIKLIHPSAIISTNVEIGTGTVVMANAVINAETVIGNHCIINTGSIVEHDNKIGKFVHISPNVSLGGNVIVDDLTHVGIGKTVKNNIVIKKNIVIGAGAVVTKNVILKGTYIGIPAKKL